MPKLSRKEGMAVVFLLLLFRNAFAGTVQTRCLFAEEAALKPFHAEEIHALPILQRERQYGESC